MLALQHLKHLPSPGSSMQTSIHSNILVKTVVPFDTNYDPRSTYVRKWVELHIPPPWIAYSFFVPWPIVVDLMREKKDAAIAVKFVPNRNPPDRITNMEGALHTFVTPIVEATILGDYVWRGGHSIHIFGHTEGKMLGRRVLVSALVQQDYENEAVMAQLAVLDYYPVTGDPHFPDLLHWSQKQNPDKRKAYDKKIHAYLIYHLTWHHHLPSHDEAKHKITSNSLIVAIQDLELAIAKVPGRDVAEQMTEWFMLYGEHIISLEVMFNSAVWQTRNELVLLEKLCKRQGYVYTFNPPAIFVRFFKDRGTQLLNRIHILALKYVLSTMRIKALRCVSWGDFNDPKVVDLLHDAVQSNSIQILSNDELFRKKYHISETSGEGLYHPPKGAGDSVLVIHNNSDGFGQNIETEAAGGSLDGVIGAYSSTAASLLRHRIDLCDHSIKIERR